MDTDAQIDGGRPGITALFRAYAAGKAAEEWHGEWGAALFYRPPAILAAPLLLRLGVPATAVTLFSLLLVLALPVVAWNQGALAMGVVALLVGILDCLDGTIARASGTASRRGHYLDFVTGVLFRIGLYTAIGLAAAQAAPGWLGNWSLPLALVAALLAITARLCRLNAERMSEPSIHQAPAARGFSDLAFSVLSGIDPLTPLIVILLSLTGGMGWLVLWLAFYSTLDFLHAQVEALRRVA
jgi:phosphatidylglycerophosphate synthase